MVSQMIIQSKSCLLSGISSYRQCIEKKTTPWFFFREFNTLSASDYKFNDQDASFLIFTDDNILLRPIFGSINLLVATTISVYGGLALPFDSGKALKDGTMGILMSLPELAFLIFVKAVISI